MSKAKIAIVGEYKSTSDFLYKELKNLFEESIDIKSYSFEKDDFKADIDCDLILITDTSYFEKVNKESSEGTEIIVLNRTLTKEGLNKLIDLKKDKKAMLVNASMNTAVNTVSTIYKLGIRHINLIPVYPGLKDIPNINLAITPGESSFVPANVNKIIDIGDRVFDISTIMDIIIRFDLNHILDENSFREYMKKIVPSSFGLEMLMGKTNRLKSQFDLVLNLLDVGLVSTNATGMVNAINEKAERILGYNKSDIIGKKGEEIIPEIPFKKALENKEELKGKIVKINDWDIVLTLKPIEKYNTIYGAVAVIKKYSKTEKMQQKLRAQLIDKGHIAQYYFDDIIGESEEINKAKNIAKRMAKSNSTILLIGESGTGKELFAQAIHNESVRKNSQFVAVNCAALPENLLESELFGYEKGAFTGASKEGKPGLFELAHKGTLFLDEISEMPAKLQTRLLRVLEEREVMRIGGEEVINVDVRVIAASNKNLKSLVKKNKFRRDLYYRLSVLPMKIPPLRERKCDITELINNFKKEMNTDFELSNKALDAFYEHEWEGNIRELRNYIEYFSNLNKEVIEISDFPFTLLENTKKDYILSDKEKEIFSVFKDKIKIKIDDYKFILKELKRRYEKGIRAGRRSLAEAAQESNIYLSEMEVRKMLKRLDEFNFVEIGKGRQGTKLTSLGIKISDYLEKSH